MTRGPNLRSLSLWCLVALLAPLALGRFIGGGVLPALRSLSGDFAAVFPTAYFAQFRPDFPTEQVWAGWYYGPMLHFLTAPLLLLPSWEMVPPTWALVNCVALLVAYRSVCRLMGYQPATWREGLVLPMLWLLYQPLVNCLAQGNIEIVEMAIVLVALIHLGRPDGRWAGTLVGVASMIKFLPIGFLTWLAVRRQWRAVAWGIATMAVIAGAAAATLGWKQAISLENMEWSIDNPLAGLQELSLTTLFLHRSSVLLHDEGATAAHPTPSWFPSSRAQTALRVGWVASAVVAALYALIILRRRRPKPLASEVGVLFMAMFMLLPWNHDYYYIFALVPISLLFISARQERQPALLGAALVGYVLISPPLPYSWVDFTGLLPVAFSDLVNFLSLPIVGALLIWIVVTARMFMEDTPPRPTGAPAGPSSRWVVGLSMAGVIVIVGLALWPRGITAHAMADIVEAPLAPPLQLTSGPALALSPDGRHVVYVAATDHGGRLCVGAPGGTAPASCLEGTAGGSAPFFSPDGQWIGFFAGGQIRKVRLQGGPVTTMGEARGGVMAHWEADGSLLVASAVHGIMRMPPAGGAMDVLVPQLEHEGPYSWPSTLPGGAAILMTVAPAGGGLGAGTIVAVSTLTGTRSALFSGTQPHYDPASGLLRYVLSGRLLTVPFDPVRLRASGPSMPAVGQVLVTPDAGPFVAYDDRGRVLLVPGQARPVLRRELVWVTREGHVTPLPVASSAFRTPRLSPDGAQVVAGIEAVATDLWKFDVGTGDQTRLTYTTATNDTPVWTPDGELAFSVPLGSGRRSAVLLAPPGGTELDAQRLWSGDGPVSLGGWAGRSPVVVGMRGTDLWLLHPDRAAVPGSASDRSRVVVVNTVARESGATVDPAGRWVAYASDESGRSEIYVQPLAALSSRVQVSRSGGVEPVWSRDGRELFFRSGQGVFAARWSDAVFAPPQRLFEGDFVAGDGPANYDVTPDGRRLLMVRPDGAASGPVTLQWGRLPAGRPGHRE